MIYNYLIYQSFLYGVNNSKAFSLIELSIVLIIIGLLVAGITGGQSLIKSAKMRTITTEIRNYEQALNSFYLLKGYLPGDIRRTGKIGYLSGQIYDSNSFSAPYNSNGNGYGIPNEFSAPFVDLYLAKIIDFEPKNTNLSYAENKNGFYINNGSNPISKAYKNIIYSYRYTDDRDDGPSYWRYGLADKNNIFLAIAKGSDFLTFPKIIWDLDKKIDDGIYNTGKFRGYCWKSDNKDSGRISYESAIKNKHYCTEALITTSF